MRLLRVAILVLLFLTGGAVISYAVAWWATNRFDAYCPLSFDDGVEQNVASEWPLAIPESWLATESPLADDEGIPRLWLAHPSTGIAVRYFVADYPKWARTVYEQRAGWPAPCASLFSQYRVDKSPSGWPAIGTPRSDPHPWIDGIHLLDRPVVTSTGIVSTSLFPVHFPIRPIWSGLLIDAAFYGTILFALSFGAGRIVQARRLRAGLCPDCKYPIGASPVCTECGTPIPGKAQAPESGAA